MSASSSGGGYLAALAELHDARADVARGRTAMRDLRAERERSVRELDAALAHQRERLRRLAADLRAPLAGADLAAGPGGPTEPALAWDALAADVRARLHAADEAAEEARRTGRLPQLLPGWSSQLARAAAVYLLFCVPAAFGVSLTYRVTDVPALQWWFALVWPLITAVAGAVVIGRGSRPRLEPEESEKLVARLRPSRTYPWLGFLMAISTAFFTQLMLETLFGPT